MFDDVGALQFDVNSRGSSLSRNWSFHRNKTFSPPFIGIKSFSGPSTSQFQALHKTANFKEYLAIPANRQAIVSADLS